VANAYYTCNLLPIQLLASAGYSPVWLGNRLVDPNQPARREALAVHPMTCPYVTQLVAAAEQTLANGPTEDCLVVAGGCDAMRRLGDLLLASFPGQVFVLSMPRSGDTGAQRFLADELRSLERWLTGRATGTAESAAGAEPPTVDYPRGPSPGGVFVVAGPLSDASFLDLLGELGVAVSGLESCTSPDRRQALAGVAEADFSSLAAELLRVGVCPRRSTRLRREHLRGRLDAAAPSSVIYARQSFCDPGAYDAVLVAQLAQERGLPYLEVEIGFPFEASGPLRTRVEAFLESQLLDDDLLDWDLPAVGTADGKE